MRIIDAHMHVDLAGYDVDTLVSSMDQKGIATSWLLTWEEINPPIEALHMDLHCEGVLKAFDKYPDRFVPFYAPDPASDQLKEQFGRFKGLGIKGCGELKVSRKWDEPLIGSYLKLVQEYNLALIFHMETPRMQYIRNKDGFFQWAFERLMNDKFNGVSRFYITRFAERTGFLKRKIQKNQVHFPGILFDFAALEKRIQQFSGIRFIGHGPDFWNNISLIQHPKYLHQKGPIKSFGIIDRMLNEYENFYCDISGTSGFNALIRDPVKSKVFLQKHASKILYGTDNTRYPLQELVASMKLSQEQQELIFHKNAEMVLN